MIYNSKIDVLINGKDANKIEILNIESIKNYGFKSCEEFKGKINNKNVIENSKSKLIIKENPNIVNEELDVTQGKLNIGLLCNIKDKNIATIYNMVLGGGANSKLFKNVREKASLAYTVASRYLKQKNAIIIRAGIELSNYDKTIEIIKKQLDDMKNGNITDDEFRSAKQLMLSTIKLIPEIQEDMLWFTFMQCITNENLTVEQYYKNIEQVTKEQVIEEAKNVSIDTIYFLKNYEDKK